MSGYSIALLLILSGCYALERKHWDLASLFDAAGSDKHWRHGYHRYYERELAPYKSLAGLRLLEIGVESGASLQVWLDYFTDLRSIEGAGLWFPKENATALDQRAAAAKKSCEFQPAKCSMVKIHEVDQSNRTALRRLALSGRRHGWDIIIDDGSHVPKHQLLSFLYLFPKLRPGGLYVIEDVETSYMNHEIYGYPLAGGLGKRSSDNVVETFKDLVDVVMRSHFRHNEFSVLGPGVDNDIVRLGFGDGLIFIEKRPSGPDWKLGRFPQGFWNKKFFTAGVQEHKENFKPASGSLEDL